MYLVIFSRYMESDVFYFKTKKEIKKFFDFEELCCPNVEIYKANKIDTLGFLSR